MKYFDWERASEIVESNPNSIISAGLAEDWTDTSAVIFAKGSYCNGHGIYCGSRWATPVVDVDGRKIPCYVTNEPDGFCYNDIPEWWGNGDDLKPYYLMYLGEDDGWVLADNDGPLLEELNEEDWERFYTFDS